MEREYQNILKQELSRRMGQNQRYSLRAFSRDLEMTPGQLSRILNGSRNLSVQKARWTSEKLFSSKSEQNYFVCLVEFETARDERAKATALARLSKIRGLKQRLIQIEDFQAIAEWHHTAILTMASSQEFDLTPKGVSKQLGISVFEAKLAIERLVYLNLLRREGQTYVAPESGYRTGNETPSSAIRSHHRQMIQKALGAIDGQEISERILSSKTIAISKSSIKEVQQKIEEFKKEIEEIVESKKARDSVYQLNIQFFNLGSTGKGKTK